MYIEELSSQELNRTGFSHKAVITYDDLDGTAATSLALTVGKIARGGLISAAGYRLVTAFDGTSTTNLVIDFGYDYASLTDDPDAFIDNLELHNDGTEILGSDGNGAVFATLRTGWQALEAADLEVLFTATGANLTDLTSGEVHVYWKQSDLTKA